MLLLINTLLHKLLQRFVPNSDGDQLPFNLHDFVRTKTLSIDRSGRCINYLGHFADSNQPAILIISKPGFGKDKIVEGTDLTEIEIITHNDIYYQLAGLLSKRAFNYHSTKFYRQTPIFFFAPILRNLWQERREGVKRYKHMSPELEISPLK